MVYSTHNLVSPKYAKVMVVLWWVLPKQVCQKQKWNRSSFIHGIKPLMVPIKISILFSYLGNPQPPFKLVLLVFSKRLTDISKLFLIWRKRLIFSLHQVSISSATVLACCFHFLYRWHLLQSPNMKEQLKNGGGEVGGGWTEGCSGLYHKTF